MMEIFGIVGLLVISVSIWLKEKTQDVWFIIGGLALLVYSVSIQNTIFVILQLVFILSALIELLKKKRK